jgi:hypothetical protein
MRTVRLTGGKGAGTGSEGGDKLKAGLAQRLREQAPDPTPAAKLRALPKRVPVQLPVLSTPTASLSAADQSLLHALDAIDRAAAKPPSAITDFAAEPASGAAHKERPPGEPPPEVMRLPAAWYAEPEPERPSPWAAEIKAGLIGLGVGLGLVVPMGLFFGGWLGPERQPPPRTAAPERVTEIAPVRAQPAAAQQIQQASLKTEIEADPDVILAEARRAMTVGEIETARLLLAHPVSVGQGEAMLLLGETFDPNVLAALGTRGVVADVSKARTLYDEAARRGVAVAKVRLRGLN